MCESCDHMEPGAMILIEFPASGSTYEFQEHGVYAYDEYPEGSVLEGQPRRRFIDRHEQLEVAQREHPKAKWVNCSAFVPVTIPDTSPEWLDPEFAGEGWTGE